MLLADAYDGARLPAARYLAKFNFDVTEAIDGEQALRKIVAAPPELILADWSLPLIPATALCEWLDQCSFTRRIPVIVLVGDCEPGDVLPPTAGILVKPFPFAAMVEEIRRVLRAAHS